MFRILPILLMVLITLTGCSTHKVRDGFPGATYKIKTIGIIPIEVAVSEIDASGTETILAEYTSLVTKGSTNGVEKGLQEKGYNIKVISPESLSDKEIHSLKEQYSRSLFLAMKDRQAPLETEFSEAIGDVAARNHVDGILLLAIGSKEKSYGQIAKDFGKSLMIAVATLGNGTIIFHKAMGWGSVMLVDNATRHVVYMDTHGSRQAIHTT